MRVIHRFYLHPEKTRKKKIVAYIVYIISLIAAVIILALGYRSFIPLIFIPIILSFFASFVDVPMGRKSGHLIYYSPLLLASALKKGVIELHGGTLFDYYFTLTVNRSENRNRKMVIYSYLEGLINLLAAWDEKSDNVKLSANTYFISPKTASKLGFRHVSTNHFQKLLMLFNYLPIMISYSIANGKLSFPNVLQLKSYECTIGELRKNEDYLKEMFERIKR